MFNFLANNVDLCVETGNYEIYSNLDCNCDCDGIAIIDDCEIVTVFCRLLNRGVILTDTECYRMILVDTEQNKLFWRFDTFTDDLGILATIVGHLDTILGGYECATNTVISSRQKQ